MLSAVGEQALTTDPRLYLISADASRPSGQPWTEDDYDVCDGWSGGRPHLQAVAQADVELVVLGAEPIPALAADSVTAETREAAVAAFKASLAARAAK